MMNLSQSFLLSVMNINFGTGYFSSSAWSINQFVLNFNLFAFFSAEVLLEEISEFLIVILFVGD